MASDVLKQKIHDVLTRGYFNGTGDLVDVSDGEDDNIHVVIVSRKLDDFRAEEKDDLIWEQLVQNLAPEEWGQISLFCGVSPEEVKAGPGFLTRILDREAPMPIQ